MYHKAILFIIILYLNLMNPGIILAQENQPQDTKIRLTSQIVDANGNPVSDAWIYGDGGSVWIKSGKDGSFEVSVSTNSFLLVEKDGYNTVRIKPEQGTIPKEISLESPAYQLTESDRVNLPFTNMKKRDITGSVTVLDPEEILKYDGKQDLYSGLNGRIPGLFGNADIYGLGEALFIVDGIPRPSRININQQSLPEQIINLQEISKITVLKDISSRLLYGPQADVPVVLITTKQGHPYKRQMNVRLETGTMNPISYPKYLDAASYMTLYNEALVNDGKLTKYDSESIEKTRNGTNPILYPDEDYFNSTYLRNNRPFYNFSAQASGGNDRANYFTFIHWNRQESLISLGRKELDDLFNIRGNVNYDITQRIKMKFMGLAMFDIHKGPNGDFWENASSFLPNRSPVLVPITDFDQVPSTSIIDGQYVLGGTSEYQTNIYGDLVRTGYRNSLSRYLQVNTGLDFDLNSLTKGLRASANLAFDLYNYYETQLLNQYAIYEPALVNEMNEDSLILIKHGVDVKEGSESIIRPNFYRKIGFYSTINYDKIFNENHEINAVGVTYLDHFVRNDSYAHSRNLHFGIQANYNYKHKYAVQLGGVLAGSPAFAKENRYSFSPAAGLAWVISEENFFPSPMYLKLKANWGQVNTDRDFQSEYYFRTNFTRGPIYYYRDQVSANRTAIIESVSNPGIDWAKRSQLTLGFNAALFDYTLKLEGAYFSSRFSGVVTQRTGLYPHYVGVLPYINYNSFNDQGIEIGLNYNKSFSALEFSFGANLTYTVPKVIKLDEPNYEYDYLKRTGKPTDAIFGLVAQGFYTEVDFTNGELNGDLPVPSFGEVQPGDIRYEDLNDDGRIDINDEKVIGNGHARMQYGLHLRLEYKMLELFVLGTGQTGQSSIYNGPYYWVYGDRKYPEYITGRWTPETSSLATYPRLSSTDNANNFRNSTYWLYEEDWFTLHTVQLTFNLPYRLAQRTFLRNFQVYFRASNLFTISENQEKRELNIGTEPQFRLATIGINTSF